MNKYLLPALIIGTLAFTGCARHSKIIVDPQGIDMGTYQNDLAQCQQLASQVESNVVGGIIGGAIVGALVGEISGWGSKNHHRGRRHGYRHGHRSGYRYGHRTRLSTASSAKIGAISGGLLAGSGSMHKRDRVLKNCIADRGYRILN